MGVDVARERKSNKQAVVPGNGRQGKTMHARAVASKCSSNKDETVAVRASSQSQQIRRATDYYYVHTAMATASRPRTFDCSKTRTAAAAVALAREAF